jgi:hypothetical protein
MTRSAFGWKRFVGGARFITCFCWCLICDWWAMLYAIEKYRSLPFLLARCFHYYLRATGVNIVLRVSSHVLQINKETSLSYSELNLRAIHS